MLKIYFYIVCAVALAGYIFVQSGDGFYRYPCQSPENWNSPECNKPTCLADGTCTEYLIDRTSHGK